MSNLNDQLWKCADILRNKMDASEYKNYLLGLVFYKYLSDKLLLTVTQGSDITTKEEQFKSYLEWYNSDEQEALEGLRLKLGYSIKPDYLFCALCTEISSASFQLEHLQQAFNSLSGQGDSLFSGLFDDIDLQSTKLGTYQHQRNNTLSEVIKTLDQVDLFGYEGDVIGDAYEYLIKQFATGAGKKAGEFYTPQEVSKIISHICALGQETVAPFYIYDAAMGSGSLMLNIKNYLSKTDYIHYYGQERNTTTYNLGRMNLILHAVNKEQMSLKNGDTLDADWPSEEPVQFDAVVMNPPYSADWSAADKFLSDSRFEKYGKLAPKTKADFAFLLHGYYHLKPSGTMGIVLPHGVLFRGAAEGEIRKRLLEEGAIYAVIGLPANIFYGTSIPTVIIILKKSHKAKDVLFIDASAGFEKIKTQNQLRSEDIDSIITAYKNRVNVDKQCHLASFEQIVANDYNLNISRYVDTFEHEDEVDMVTLAGEMEGLRSEQEQGKTKLIGLFNKLQLNEETQAIIEASKKVFA